MRVVKMLFFSILLLAGTSQAQTWDQYEVGTGSGQANDADGADYDGDGDMDVVAALSSEHEVKLWANQGDGTSWTGYTIATAFDGAVRALFADLNGDGNMDVVAMAEYMHTLAWWENDGTSAPDQWSQHVISAAVTEGRSIHAADIDGDGDTDMISHSMETDTVTWWENTDGTGMNWNAITIQGGVNSTAYHALESADMNGDGNLDICGASSDGFVWWENDGGTGGDWTQHIIGDRSFAKSITPADMDGDGDMDAVCVIGASYGNIDWYENLDGTGTDWQAIDIALEYDYASNARVADFDSDGDLDVVSVSGFSNDLLWWENTDDFEFEWPSHMIDGSLSGGIDVEPVDLNGDDVPDVLAGGGHGVDLWLNPMGSQSVDDNPASLPNSYKLSVPYPNPFNPTTQVRVALPAPSDLTVTVYDLNGRRVAELANGSFSEGTHTLTINGEELSSGVYFLKATVPGKMDATRKVTLTR